MDLGGRQQPGRGVVAENLYSREAEQQEMQQQQQQQQPQALTLLPPPSSSSSSTSSSPTRWPPGGGSTDDPPQASQVEKEHLFDKVVTPSDVGKLNRLVIPKQHAERYFPLDSSTNEKGLLLNFEDRDGKPWRFRYSYWNSSQSYVMTKGWSRFVKEKHLDAGDTVSFSRGIGEASRDRLFIDWKRRPEPQEHHHPHHHNHHHRASSYSPILSFGRAVVPWGRLLPPPPPPPSQPSYDHPHPHHPLYGYCGPSNPYLYLRSTSSVVGTSQFGVQYGSPAPVASQFPAETMPVADLPLPPGNSSPPKRVRLFGVDLERSPISHNSATSVATVSKNPQSPPPPPLRLSIGPSVDEEIPTRKDKQPMSLDLDI